MRGLIPVPGPGLSRLFMPACAAFLVFMTPAALPAAGARTAAADSVTAGVRADSVSRGIVLRITSDPPGARVYRDTFLLGTTPLETALTDTAATGPGTARLRIVGGDPGSWFIPVIVDSIRIPAGDPPGDSGAGSVTRHYELPIAARIDSDPAGAEVVLGDSLIGTTPLFAAVPGSVVSLTLRKEGYSSQSVVLHSGTSGYRVQLASADPDGGPKPSYLSGEVGKSYASVVIAGGTAVITGAVAAWLKDRADRSYEEYRLTGDGGTLDRVRRYDLLSGIALAAAEISLGYLVIELLSR
ncbi:MAG TPA: PEGA domain-containing protein [Bacteroidota bacterium]|nr:PEGA domain-containing protein [Bacteroidota bacterium]